MNGENKESLALENNCYLGKTKFKSNSSFLGFIFPYPNHYPRKDFLSAVFHVTFPLLAVTTVTVVVVVINTKAWLEFRSPNFGNSIKQDIKILKVSNKNTFHNRE